MELGALTLKCACASAEVRIIAFYLPPRFVVFYSKMTSVTGAK